MMNRGEKWSIWAIYGNNGRKWARVAEFGVYAGNGGGDLGRRGIRGRCGSVGAEDAGGRLTSEGGLPERDGGQTHTFGGDEARAVYSGVWRGGTDERVAASAGTRSYGRADDESRGADGVYGKEGEDARTRVLNGGADTEGIEVGVRSANI